MKVHHVTFATHEYMIPALLLRRSTRRYGLRTRIYSRWSPVIRSLIHREPEKMMARRGAGYWRWKPWIILDTFRHAKEGDLVLYSDAAVELIADPAPLFAMAAGRSIALFEHGRRPDGTPSLPMSVWTKRDCFVMMDADEPRFHDAQQFQAAFQIYRVGDESREFLRRLAEETMDDRKVSDLPNVSGLPNLPGFKDHRHDQSILSILAIKHGIHPLGDPSDRNQHAAPFFRHHRRRSSFYIRQFLGRFRPAVNDQ